MERRVSWFGPLFLIAAGVIWLLISIGTIPASNLWALTHIWPFLLIAAGLGLMLRPFWKYMSVLTAIVLVGGAALAIVYAPKLGWTQPTYFLSPNGDVYFGPGVPGSGRVVTEARDVKDFLAIKVDYPAQAFVKQGAAESVQVQAEDNVLPGIKTEVTNGTLDIFYRSDNGQHVNPTQPVKIYITVKDLAQVTFSSAGELTIDGLKTDDLILSLSGAGNVMLTNIVVQNLDVRLSGAGNVTAAGTAEDLNLRISGFGDFKGSELHDKTADVTISGAGTATVWADTELNADVSGAGSVNYYGSASVTQHISGAGAVNHLGNK